MSVLVPPAALRGVLVDGVDVGDALARDAAQFRVRMNRSVPDVELVGPAPPQLAGRERATESAISTVLATLGPRGERSRLEHVVLTFSKPAHLGAYLASSKQTWGTWGTTAPIEDAATAAARLEGAIADPASDFAFYAGGNAVLAPRASERIVALASGGTERAGADVDVYVSPVRKLLHEAIHSIEPVDHPGVAHLWMEEAGTELLARTRLPGAAAALGMDATGLRSTLGMWGSYNDHVRALAGQLRLAGIDVEVPDGAARFEGLFLDGPKQELPARVAALLRERYPEAARISDLPGLVQRVDGPWDLARFEQILRDPPAGWTGGASATT